MEKRRKLVVIGAGPSGVIAALLSAKKYEVTLLERPSRNSKPLKRVLVSGNGRANFFHEDLLKEPYGKETLSYLVDELGFNYRKEGPLYYPFYNRSECLHECLMQALKNNHVLVRYLDAIDIDEKSKSVLCLDENKNKISVPYDQLILAMGGQAYDRTENNDTLLKKLNLEYHPFLPCLCPIRTKERIPAYLKNQRLKCHMILQENKKAVYEEDGEILFKEDGLSGICVFNSTLKINEILRINPKATFEYILQYDNVNGQSLQNLSLSSLPLFLRRYLTDILQDYPKPLVFHFASLYSLKESQITFGGIDRSELNEHYQLIRHPEIHAIGELLDYNYPCGGYNMGHSLMEGYVVGKELEYGNE